MVVDINAAVGQIVSSGSFGTFIYWMGYGLLSIILIGVLGMAYHFLTFNHKVTVFPLYGSGKDGFFSVEKTRSNRVKWIKKKTAWRKMWPLFNREEIEPFDQEYIYPGKRIYVFELNNEWIPGRVNINKNEQEIRAEINPVPYSVRNWQNLQYQRNAVEYANPGWWDENKHLVLGVLTVLICVVGMLVAIYFTYKFLAPGRADIAAFTSALRSASTAPVIGPH